MSTRIEWIEPAVFSWFGFDENSGQIRGMEEYVATGWGLYLYYNKNP